MRNLRAEIMSVIPLVLPAIAALILLLMFGCATTATTPTPIVARATTVEPIRVPVLVPCLTAEQVPKPPASWMRVGKSGDYNETAAAIDLKEADEYMVRSQSRMWGCVKSFEVEAPK